MLVVPGTPVICSGMVTKILSPGGVKFLVSRLFFTNTGILWQPRFFAPLFTGYKAPFAFEANGSFFIRASIHHSPSAAYRRASGSSLFRISYQALVVVATILAAFCNALLVTLAGSTIPASNILTTAGQGIEAFTNSISRTFSTITEPSHPRCWRSATGSSSAFLTIRCR